MGEGADGGNGGQVCWSVQSLKVCVHPIKCRGGGEVERSRAAAAAVATLLWAGMPSQQKPHCLLQKTGSCWVCNTNRHTYVLGCRMPSRRAVHRWASAPTIRAHTQERDGCPRCASVLPPSSC